MAIEEQLCSSHKELIDLNKEPHPALHSSPGALCWPGVELSLSKPPCLSVSLTRTEVKR